MSVTSSNGDLRVLIGIADVDLFGPKDLAIDRHAAMETVSVYSGIRSFSMLPDKQTRIEHTREI